jgi:rhodanese-related sulfurtransferase/CBS domain-containing protein
VGRTIDTDALRRAIDGDGDGGVQLVEVLPADDFAEEHLPGARTVPLRDLTAEGVAAATLDPAARTVVYGFDSEDDRPHRAAARLEALGFTDVLTYPVGKVGWLAEGLPGEGERRMEQRVGAIARPDAAPTVGADATVADARKAVGEADVGIVLGGPDGDVVLGVLRPETFGLPDATPVRDVLQPGPSTFRPSMTIRELVEYFESSNEARAIVSTHEGRYLGLIRREDVLDG